MRVRCVWIPDLHLGTPGRRADALLDFLKHVDCDHLFLVGDIMDGWQLRRSWYWPQAHNDVVQKLLRKAQTGTRAVFVPGNYDEFTLRLNCHLNSLRARHWACRTGACRSISSGKVKRAVSYVGGFEGAVAREARRRGVDGVLCGQIHRAEMRMSDGGLHCNDGDWVESLTALVEHADGQLAVVDWSKRGPAHFTGTVDPPSLISEPAHCVGLPPRCGRPHEDRASTMTRK